METDISLTGRYLSGELSAITRQTPRELKGNWITVDGATGHNLKSLSASFPLNVMTVVTGVSGSGKSTLVNDTLYRALAQELYGSREVPEPYKLIQGFKNIDKAVRIDQSPIGRTPRSKPACLPPSAISSPGCRNRASAATNRGAFRSTCQAGAARRARAKASGGSK
jgi:excinuclease ABC subunit A